MSEPESSRAASWRWLIYGGIVAVTGIALYFVDRLVWDVLHRQIDGWTALCLILWQRTASFARGWDAATERRKDAAR